MPEIFHYQAQVKIGISRIWTAVHAGSSSDAKELLEVMFGEDSVVGTPRRVDNID